ncbi:MAG: response regulator [Bdellovibrionales bacterium]|nr:response regulator [Bdellovibrionales bacterium]
MFKFATMENKAKHILIVDDSFDNQTLLKLVLEAKGYTAECTSNGEEALKLLHTTRDLPEAILLDLNMPIMSGFDFRRHQLSDSMLKNIPVIVISGEEDVASTRKQMNSEVLQKPLSIFSLLEALERNARLH